MGGLDGRRGKALAILTGRESRVPSLLREVVHLGWSGVLVLRASHRESGIRIGRVLHHVNVVGLGRRTGGKMLGVEHTVR